MYTQSGTKSDITSESSDPGLFFQKKEDKILPVPQEITAEDYLRFVKAAEQFLTPHSDAALYLKKRGITPATAKQYHLGFIKSRTVYEPLLPRNYNCFTPVGIWIPNYRGNKLISVKCRCLGYEYGGEGSRKYELLAVCPSAMYILRVTDRGNAPLIITESELDAILLAQEGRGMFNYVALGSAENIPDVEVVNMLGTAGKVYFNADYDDAGLRAYARWKRRFPDIELALLPRGKDPTEAMSAGVDLRQWQYDLYRGKTLQLRDREQHFSPVKLTTHQDLSRFLDRYRRNGRNMPLAVMLASDIDLFAISDGNTAAVGLLSGVKPVFPDDLKDFTIVTHDAYDFCAHLSGVEQLSDVESTRLLYIARMNKDATLQELGNLYLGYAGGAPALGSDIDIPPEKLVAGDARAVAQLYPVLLDMVNSNEYAEKAYRLYKGAQKAIAQAMRTGLPLDWKEIEAGVENENNTISAYCKGLIRFKDTRTDRVHSVFEPHGTITGRFTSTSPNIQGIPKALRHAVCASQGKVFVDADFRQSELLIAAALSNDPLMSKVFSSGRDIHRESAAYFLGVEPEQVTENQRTIGKVVNFSFLYGSTPKGIQERLQEAGITISEEDSTHFHEEFIRRYKQLQYWRVGVLETCHRSHPAFGVSLPFGVQTQGGRFVPINIYSRHWGTKPINYLIQGTGADYIDDSAA